MGLEAPPCELFPRSISYRLVAPAAPTRLRRQDVHGLERAVHRRGRAVPEHSRCSRISLPFRMPLPLAAAGSSRAWDFFAA